jgi:hypothetical protein
VDDFIGLPVQPVLEIEPKEAVRDALRSIFVDVATKIVETSTKYMFRDLV